MPPPPSPQIVTIDTAAENEPIPKPSLFLIVEIDFIYPIDGEREIVAEIKLKVIL